MLDICAQVYYYSVFILDWARINLEFAQESEANKYCQVARPDIKHRSFL